MHRFYERAMHVTQAILHLWIWIYAGVPGTNPRQAVSESTLEDAALLSGEHVTQAGDKALTFLPVFLLSPQTFAH